MNRSKSGGLCVGTDFAKQHFKENMNMQITIPLPVEFQRMLGGMQRDARCYVDVDSPRPQVFYRCERNIDGCGLFLEFHVDTYANRRNELQNQLRICAQVHCRDYRLVSYYGDLGIRCRRPSLNQIELEEDFSRLSTVVSAAFTDQEPIVTDANASPSSFLRLNLPANISLSDVANRVRGGNFVLPAVQRGKVWNAARCAALWDSIMRGFSIGALSVQPSDHGTYDLLDGQQRTTAIGLGYDESNFDDHDVLWLDIMPSKSGECEFEFYVTTKAQPWGYGRSSDETKNVRLATREIREILDEVSWPQEEKRPQPRQLWPKHANCPVPFALLRKFVEEHPDVVSLKDFIAASYDRRSANWTKAIGNYDPNANSETDGKIIRAIRNLSRYRVQVLDAGNVSEMDIALYFRRIGKGGVIPSNEEMTYSVLKAKIGACFREGIEDVVAHVGLDKPSRVAALAIRYCLSSAENFFTGSVMEKIVGNDDDSSVRKDVESFVRLNSFDADVGGERHSEFKALVRCVNKQLKDEGFTAWHITRYCQKYNGDVYLFLMLLQNGLNIEWSGLTLGGIAELLTWYAPNPAYVIRKILARKSLADGISEAMRESHYGSPRMYFPLSPALVEPILSTLSAKKFPVEFIGNIPKNWPDAARLISLGYGNEAAYSRLIFACNRNEMDRTGVPLPLFQYDKALGIWAEESCPWDYDHILPHSWVDELPREERERYSWLVDSIGNLAPLEFSVNRQLSNDARNEKYPLVACNDENTVERAQIACCVRASHEASAEDRVLDVGTRIRGMATFRTGDACARIDFCSATIERFDYIYRRWFNGNGFGKLFSFADGSAFAKRRQLVSRVVDELKKNDELRKKSIRSFKVFHYDCNGAMKEFSATGNDDGLNWLVWSWISVVRPCNGYDIEFRVDREAKVQIGVVAKGKESTDLRIPESERRDAEGHWLFHRDNPNLVDVLNLFETWQSQLS